jgi:serine/threonine-protein kinase
VQIGDYEVLGRLATGGMGEVFRAVRSDGSSNVPVALKLIRADRLSDRHFLELFRAEAEVGALLQHPNIVRVIEFGEAFGVPLLVQELVDGASLARLLERSSLSPPVAAHVAVSVLAALDYAHRFVDAHGRPLGLVHRDVAAGNVLVSRTGQVKLTDFGVVKRRGRSITNVGEVKGNPEYMAPEQLATDGIVRTVDLRADIFAVGVLLYRMVEGNGPFVDVQAWLARGVPLIGGGPFAHVIARAMAVDPEARYPSAAEMSEAVACVVAPGPHAAAELAARTAAALQHDQPLNQLANRLLQVLGGVEPGQTAVADAPAVHTQVEMHEAAVVREDSDVASEGTTTRRFAAKRLLPWATRARGVLARAAAVTLLIFAAVLTFVMLLLRGSVSAGGQTTPPIAAPAHAGAKTAVAASSAVRANERAVPTAFGANPPGSTTPSPSPTAIRVRPPPVRPHVRSHATVKAAARARPSGAAPARSEPPTGLLSIDSEPWATVYLGHRKLGTTPLLRVRVPAGRQLLTLDLEDSGRRRTIPVQIETGGETRITPSLAQ